jgi:hypothetical protein
MRNISVDLRNESPYAGQAVTVAAAVTQNAAPPRRSQHTKFDMKKHLLPKIPPYDLIKTAFVDTTSFYSKLTVKAISVNVVVVVLYTTLQPAISLSHSIYLSL